MSQSGFDFTTLSIEKRKLDVPDLDDIVTAFNTKLSQNFAQVEAKIVECPDLTQKPFNLAAPGLNGNSCIFDIGGPSFLLPLVKREKIYDLRSITKVTADKKAFVIGAGAGPWPRTKTNCEMTANVVIEQNEITTNSSRIAKIYDRKNIEIEILPTSEYRFCLLANFYSSRGEPGKVIQLRCKRRIGTLDFSTAVRETLASSFPDQIIGVGGVFVLLNGQVKLHIMPDFSSTPLKSDSDLNNWLTFHEISAPLVNVGTIVSKDPGLDLRLQHFHCFGPNGAGHYHYDTTPDEAEYLAYFTFANHLYRVDRPVSNVGFGSD